MNKLYALIVALFATATLNMIAIPSQAATFYNNNDGLIYGNICQTPYGWQFVNWAPAYTACYSPGWNAYGYILNN